MHISEGVLSPGLLVGGALVAVVGVSMGLRRMEPEQIPGHRNPVGRVFCRLPGSCSGWTGIGPSDSQRPAGPAAWLAGLSRHSGGTAAPGPAIPVRGHYSAGGQHGDHGPSGGGVPLPVSTGSAARGRAENLCPVGLRMRIRRCIGRSPAGGIVSISGWRRLLAGRQTAGRRASSGHDHGRTSDGHLCAFLAQGAARTSGGTAWITIAPILNAGG